jgi:hypothetical protein
MFASQMPAGRSARRARRLSQGAAIRSHSLNCLRGLPAQGVSLDAYTLRGLPTQGASMETNSEIRIGIAIESLFASPRGSPHPRARFAPPARLCWGVYVKGDTFGGGGG